MLITVRESRCRERAARRHHRRVTEVVDPAPGHPLADPGRFMLAGDWHGDAAWARRANRRAPVGAGDRRMIIQLGDFGIWPGHSGPRYLDSVAAALAQANAICLFIDGNHEDFPQLARYPIRCDGLREVRPRLFHLPRGTRWTWKGIRFLALGGATSLDRPWRTAGVDWWPDEELRRADLDRAIARGACDVMLTHDASGIDVPGLPPASTWEPAEVERADRHRDSLRKVVDALRPTRLVHGHFHSRHDAELPLDSGHRVAVVGLANDWTRSDGHLEEDIGSLL